MEERASTRRNNDVSAVENEMPERLRNSKNLQSIKRILYAVSQEKQFCATESHRRHFCLPFHQFRHALHERLNQFGQLRCAQIARSSPEDPGTMVDGVDLQFGQSRCCSLPERIFPYFTEKFSCGLPRKPSVPVWPG